MPNSVNAGIVSLHAATAADLTRIENMMQFYNYDLSESSPVELGENGLFTLRPKEAYWAKPSVKPYIAIVSGELAGFAVVDDEVVYPDAEFNIGYFFLARRYRRRGLAQQMASQLFRLHPGRWEVYHFASNAAADRFWAKAIVQVSFGQSRVEDIVRDEMRCRLHRFSISEFSHPAGS